MSDTSHEHVGEIGEAITVTGIVRTAARVKGFTTYTPDRALLVVDDGIVLAKFVTSAAWAYDVQRGDQITALGTVKAHTEWRGAKQTVLTRVTRTDLPPATPDPQVAEPLWEIVNPNEAGPRPFPRQTDPLAEAKAILLQIPSR